MNDWLTFLQGASNAAASNVSGPIDLITWALRKAGVPIDTPVGGSEWMAQRGLTKPAGGVAGLLGEAAGMSAPIAVAAKAPQIAAGLLQMGENAAAPSTLGAMGQRGAIVYHGSKDPTWIDRKEAFDGAFTQNMPSKYLWVTQNKKTAQTYAGISEMQLWKAENGLGPAPNPSAGIREFDIKNSAKVLKVNDFNATATKLGVDVSRSNSLESLLDAAKLNGYDAVKMEMDGGNIAVLNPAALKRKGNVP